MGRDLRQLLAQRPGVLEQVAAGSENGTVTFHLHDHQPDGSSLFRESMGNPLMVMR
jgi:hypothetical protein